MTRIKNFLNRIVNALHFSVVIGGLGDIFDLWRKGDGRERAIIMVVFAPMFISIGGMLFSIVSFVLFVLPSFVLRFLGWLLLVVLFGAGGKYAYERLTGQKASPFSYSSDEPDGDPDADYTDVPFIEDSGAPSDSPSDSSSSNSRERVRQRWAERVRQKK